jgi:predicted PurR-regulated permease PerM
VNEPTELPPENCGLPEAEARRIDFYWAGGVVASMALLFIAVSLMKGVAIPVFLALALAYVLNPLVTAIASKGPTRTFATVLVFAALSLLLYGVALYVIPVFSDQASRLPSFFKAASVQLVPWIETHFNVSVPELIRQRAEDLGSQASLLLSQNAPTAAKLLGSIATNTATLIFILLAVLVIPVLGFFFLADYPKLIALGRGLIPLRAVSLVSRRFAEADDVLSAFVRGQLTVGAMLSVFYSVGLSIARIEMAIVIGLIAGFGTLVPYVGPGIGVCLALIGVALSWSGPWQLVVVAVTFLGTAVLEGLVITPRVVGQKVGLPPVAIIICVLAFAEVFGFVGVLLAVPLTAVLKVVLKVVITRYRRTRVYLTGAPLK